MKLNIFFLFLTCCAIAPSALQSADASVYSYLKTETAVSIRLGHWAPHSKSSRGTILLLPGRTEYVERYKSIAMKLQHQGWDVWIKDWRGQGLSTRLLPNPQKNYINSFGTYLYDLDRVVDYIYSLSSSAFPSKRFVLLGHSMGGHLAMRYALYNTHRISGVVLTSPMIDIGLSDEYRTCVRGLIALASILQIEDSYVYGQGDYNPDTYLFVDNPVTNDPDHFASEKEYFNKNPAILVNGTTYGWARASLESIEALNRLLYNTQSALPDIPVLLFSGELDQVVNNQAQYKMCERLSDCTFISVHDAKHDIMLERPVVTDIFWLHLNAFLERQLNDDQFKTQ